MKFVMIACLSAGALAAVGCANGVPTGPSGSVAVSGSAASQSPRSGDLHVTKECSGFDGNPGSFCTIKSSNLKAIEVESTILYLQPAKVFTDEGSDVVLDLPGPGNNKAFGHCSLTLGACRFLGGTGKFTWFQAEVAVTFNPEDLRFHWDGTYSFSPKD
jgi:hypothetical protein